MLHLIEQFVHVFKVVVLELEEVEGNLLFSAKTIVLEEVAEEGKEVSRESRKEEAFAKRNLESQEKALEEPQVSVEHFLILLLVQENALSIGVFRLFFSFRILLLKELGQLVGLHVSQYIFLVVSSHLTLHKHAFAHLLVENGPFLVFVEFGYVGCAFEVKIGHEEEGEEGLRERRAMLCTEAEIGKKGKEIDGEIHLVEDLVEGIERSLE